MLLSTVLDRHSMDSEIPLTAFGVLKFSLNVFYKERSKEACLVQRRESSKAGARSQSTVWSGPVSHTFHIMNLCKLNYIALARKIEQELN